MIESSGNDAMRGTSLGCGSPSWKGALECIPRTDKSPAISKRGLSGIAASYGAIHTGPWLGQVGLYAPCSMTPGDQCCAHDDEGGSGVGQVWGGRPEGHGRYGRPAAEQRLQQPLRHLRAVFRRQHGRHGRCRQVCANALHARLLRTPPVSPHNSCHTSSLSSFRRFSHPLAGQRPLASSLSAGRQFARAE